LILDAGCWSVGDRERSGDMSYRSLEIWQIARHVSIEVHKVTLTELPKFEFYEEGSQIRRSAKSVGSNIVEGYGRRRYKQEFVKHLVYALGSCDETMDHLEVLFETGSLKNKELYDRLHERIDTLGRKLNQFLKSVEAGHRSER
jgi:four helix bundle protein